SHLLLGQTRHNIRIDIENRPESRVAENVLALQIGHQHAVVRRSEQSPDQDFILVTTQKTQLPCCRGRPQASSAPFDATEFGSIAPIYFSLAAKVYKKVTNRLLIATNRAN